MSRYEKALEKAKAAEAECLAELFLECCEGDPHITDEDGNWLSREEVYNKLLRGDVK